MGGSLLKLLYRIIHTKHPPLPDTLGPLLNRGGGCLKRGENQIIFLARKIHFHNFFPIFFADTREIFVLFRGGWNELKPPPS